MKKFNIYDYQRQCPIAKSVENELNCSGSPKVKLENTKECLKGLVPSKFFGACILYWSQTEYYDERNRVAVLVSKEIVKQFSNTPFLCMSSIAEDTKREAFGFTHFAHRYIQNKLFNVILEDLKQKDHAIYRWHQEQEFVIDPILEKAVPANNCRKTDRT